MVVKTMKNLYRSPAASDIKTILETEENQNMERKIESFVFSGFSNGTLAAETKWLN